MAKIDFPDGNSPFFNPAAYGAAHAEAKKTKDRGRAGSARRPDFRSSLETAAEAENAADAAARAGAAADGPSEEALRGLLDEVHASGDDLKDNATPDAIRRYKSAVRGFLHYVVENGYSVEERVSGGNILKRKKFTMIQVVDRKLEQLAAGILAGQRSQLDILARVEEIAGLLVDLIR
jgi:uncharacterized protein YaaR (DUF327 family)